MVYCMVTTCKREGLGKGFFKVPKNLEKREKWKNALNLENLSEKSSAKQYVCFRHFADSDMKKSGQRLTPKAGKFTDITIEPQRSTKSEEKRPKKMQKKSPKWRKLLKVKYRWRFAAHVGRAVTLTGPLTFVAVNHK